jgi:dTDP-4-dehydrorhamnose reductase
MSAPRVLVTGACGLLGAHVVEAFRATASVAGVDRNDWWGDRPLEQYRGDLTDGDFVRDVIARTRPAVIVHCAAMVDVDRCEREPAAAYAVNGGMTRLLARASAPGTTFVYVSTDSIFKGDRALVTEQELPCPRTVYARSKLHGEWETALAGRPHLIVRTSLYGWSSGRKKTSAEWLYGSLASRTPITLFEDFFFTPIYAVDLAQRIVDLVAGGHTGVVHAGGADRVSKLQFGRLMAEAGGLSMDAVTPGSLAAAGFDADRPSEMSIDSSRCAALVGRPMPGAREGLDRFIADHGVTLSARFDAARAHRNDGKG